MHVLDQGGLSRAVRPYESDQSGTEPVQIDLYLVASAALQSPTAPEARAV